MDSTAIFEKQHSEQAAVRGVPSLVWRAGQERRMGLIRQWAPLDGARALVDGCGVGMYVRSPTRPAPAFARRPARRCPTPMACSTWC